MKPNSGIIGPGRHQMTAIWTELQEFHVVMVRLLAHHIQGQEVLQDIIAAASFIGRFFAVSVVAARGRWNEACCGFIGIVAVAAIYIVHRFGRFVVRPNVDLEYPDTPPRLPRGQAHLVLGRS